MSSWPSITYPEWSATCDTLHAHTQVLGKLAAELAPPEPQLQHAALRLTARGWETLPLPSPDGTGSFVVALDLHQHEARVETSDGQVQAVPLVPDRPVGEVTRGVLAAVAEVAGEAKIDPEPQEVAWKTPLDADTEHATYERQAIAEYFGMATRAAAVLTAFRAPFRGRSTPVNAWWGSFDLAVSLFSGDPATPPSDDFIMRNAMDSQEVAVGWWPGDPKHGGAAFYGYAHPAQPGFSEADLGVPGARWDGDLGEYVLEWSDVVAADDPHGLALDFCRSVFAHACTTCGWDADLAASAEGTPPPVA
ncbi:MAG TPA: DUF5996 family protein [Solirubrobacterales bacterium]|nr:DUF5996 family protein [Solirubrobacterales bacterium]